MKRSTGAFRPPGADRTSPFNKVASITRGTATVSFDYNGEHTRIRQVTASQTTLYITDPATGVSLEKVTGSGGSIQWNLYVRVGDRLVAQRIDHTPAGGGASSIAMRYFTTDHLGSVAVITDELGAVVERLSFDAWGKRRHPDGTDDPSGSITSQTTRGFTGHEMIDEVGLVNMNGRVYDPEIGRFMSADPFVQDPTNTQSLNRYSYVGNNPLSYTDPSGYFLKKIWKALVAIVIAIVAVVSGQYWIASLTGWGATASLVTAAAIGGAIAGGITGGGNLRSILTGAISGAAFAGLGTAGLEGLEAVMAYGMTGGVTSVMGGGEFQSGFLAAGFAALAGPKIEQFAKAAGKGTASVVAGTAASAVAGGIGSVLGGGKFENGAVTGAFAYAAGRAMGPPSDRNETTQEKSSQRQPDKKVRLAQAGSSMTDALPTRVTLYRVVDLRELQSLAQNDMQFLPSPNGAEVKYFWTDPATATAFGNSLATQGQGWFVPPLHVTSVQIETRLLDNSMFISLADIPLMGRVTAVALPINLLPSLSPATIVGAVPLP